ncbi:hypothetical protein [Veillonella sp. 3913]|uniref:hypothetical protein n=1 Tax=Veillonella sp. 3913 TaxID=2490952 RepID=UPI0013E0E372|nr:hypothetical protein [Veillonella sp. 3913]
MKKETKKVFMAIFLLSCCIVKIGEIVIQLQEIKDRTVILKNRIKGKFDERKTIQRV